MADIKDNSLAKYEPLWGRWHVDSLLGEGAFGKVYKVRREEYGKTYYSAVKIISIPQDEAEIRRMRSEGLGDVSLRKVLRATVADIISEIDLMSKFRGHSHIVSFEDHKVIERSDSPGQAEGSEDPDSLGWDILMRMELLQNLPDCAMAAPLSPEEVIKLGIHISRALELCVQNNITHRDIKPDNIFVTAQGDYKLGDFGVARQLGQTLSGLSQKGTYSYMAPEVFRGKSYNAGVDIYSLGIVMYCYLNKNRTPFLPDFPQIIMPNHRSQALIRRMDGDPIPDLKGISPALNALVLKACAYDRSERFASPTDLRQALESLARARTAHVTGQASTDKAASDKKIKLQEILKKKIIIPVAALSAMVALVITALIVFMPESHSSESPSSLRTDKTFIPTRLDFSNKKITNEQLVSMVESGDISQNTVELHLDSNRLTDIPSLKSLTHLQTLYLSNNSIEDITFLTSLASLSQLKNLSLRSNIIQDLTPLESLSELNLNYLNLSDNKITDITPLKALTNLVSLDLSKNDIRDFSSLQGLTQLAWLEITDNDIQNISSLQELTALESLKLNDNDIRDITPLMSLTNLRFLHIEGNKIEDITPLGALKKLEILYITEEGLQPHQIESLQATLPHCKINP
ncbi:MAG: leucine-rich repeat domain-containing protein [Peptococcaceae bacterium]|nr:leucine-rich repeat domain-containing protein [Peptococcaceae bacterium]